MISAVLKIGSRVVAMPVVHGSGDFAWEVRRMMLANDFDCLAVPLPPSFKRDVCQAVIRLPSPAMIVQPDWIDGLSIPSFDVGHNGSDDLFDESSSDLEDEDLSPEDEEDAERIRQEEAQADRELGMIFREHWAKTTNDLYPVSYVPIDPCQPVIAAIRVALGDHLPIHFVDKETSTFEPHSSTMPDGYALKRLQIEHYAAAVLPGLQPPKSQQWRQRVQAMAWNLRQLSIDYKRILFVVGILEWPWVRQAFLDRNLLAPQNEPVHQPTSFQLTQSSLYFLMGELPFITELHENARSEMGDEANVNIDGVKELLIKAREYYREEYKQRARKITPKMLGQILKYTRNLTLIDHRFTPQLVDIVTAAQQIAGDGYALQVLETAKHYDPLDYDLENPYADLSLNRVRLSETCIGKPVSRLPGQPLIWRDLQLIPKPDSQQTRDWKMAWNPYAQCSWPPEDEVIENFRQTVFDRAREVMGADLVQTEKFTTSIRDGIDIRETVRHWYDNEIHVKILPPTRGTLDVAVMLFDSPADPRDYPWRTTWFAEHPNESTLAFYATDFAQQPVGPGICLASYGGAMFIFPPVPITDIWSDRRLDFASTLEERLLAAACLHSQSSHIALVSSAPPGLAWRQLAKRFKKTLVHLPLGRFSDATIQQLRMVHVLNGQHIRSYAANYIRKV